MNHPDAAKLEAWTYGWLEASEEAALERHLAECAACARRLSATARLSTLLEDAVVRTPAPSPRRARVALALAAGLALGLVAAGLRWSRPPEVAGLELSAAEADRVLRISTALGSAGRPVAYERQIDPAWR